MPGGKWVGKELDRFVATAIAANKPRDQIFAEARTRFGCSKQTILRSFHRRAGKGLVVPPVVYPMRIVQPEVSRAAAPATNDGSDPDRDRFVETISRLAGEAYDRVAKDVASRLEEFVASALADSGRLITSWPSTIVARPTLQLAAPDDDPITVEVAPVPHAEPVTRDVVSDSLRVERDERIGLVLDDPEESRRSSTTRSGRPPQLGMRSRERIETSAPVAAPRRAAPRRSADQEDLEVARRIKKISGRELAVAIADAEANKHPGKLPDVITLILPSFAAQSEGERSLLRERVRRRDRRKKRKAAAAPSEPIV